MSSIEKRITGAVLNAIRARRDEHPAKSDASSSSAAAIPAKVREAAFSDFEAVADLKQRWGLAPDAIENWDRLWRQNPALEHAPHARPMGWVLEADRKIVGYIGNISLLCHYGDKTLSAVTAHGLVVEPSYRGVSVSLNAAFFRQKAVDFFVCTTTIPAVGRISAALKADPLPQEDYWTVLFWVLQPTPFVRSMMKKLEIKSTMARVGGVFGSLAIAADRTLRGRRPKKSSLDFQVSEIGVAEIGDEFEDLWKDKVREKTRLLADRSVAALRWHYEIPGDRGAVRVLRCSKNGRLAGYAVVRNEEPDENGLSKSVLADLLVRGDDPAVVETLLTAAYAQASQAGSHILEVMGFPENIRRVFAQSRPYQRRYPACPYYYKAADPDLHQVLSDSAAWYACPFDGDATLIRASYSSGRQQEEAAGQQAVQEEGRSPVITADLSERERTEVF